MAKAQPMRASLIERQSGTQRAANWLITASALGEFVVGVAGCVFPAAVMRFLLGTSIEGAATVVARMAGIAVAALGIAWWTDRNHLDARRLRAIAPGYLVYNLGIGLLFLNYTWSAERFLPVPWLVAAAHLLFGSAFAVIVGRTPLNDR